MKNKKVKIVVDYTDGYYKIIGERIGEPFFIKKPIRGKDRDNYYKASYSTRLINLRRMEIRKLLENIQKEEPTFVYSEKMIKEVDPLMFKLLEDWDKMNGTTYSREYIKVMVQDFSEQEESFTSNDYFENACKEIRSKKLEELGIDISYNVGLFRVSREMKLIDRIRGIFIARRQRELINVNYNYSLFLKKDYFLEDDRKFSKKIEEENYYLDDDTPEDELDDYRDVLRFDEDDGTAIPLNNGKHFKKVDSKNNVKDFKKDNTPKSKKVTHLNGKKDKKKDKNKKKITGARTKLTKKQREGIRRKERKEYNSHYNTQMRLKAERELKKKQKEERIKKAKAIKEEQELMNKITRTEDDEKKKNESKQQEKIKTEQEEIDSIMKEIKRIEDDKKKKTESKQQEEVKKKQEERDSIMREIQRIYSEENKEKNDKKTLKFNNHWTRKLKNQKDSIKNKVPHLEKHGKKVIKRAVTLVAVGAILFSIGVGTMNNIKVHNYNNNETTISTEVTKDTDEKEKTGTQTEVQSETEPEVQTETQSETEPKTQAETQSETESKIQVGTQSETEIGTQNELQSKEESETQTETENGTGTQADNKSNEEKIAEFKNLAIQKYKDAIIVGINPQIGDLLIGQTYSENPDGSGKTGYFRDDVEYSISHINIVTAEGYKVVRTEGKSLSDLLAEYPDCITYNVHFINSKTGGRVGFVTQEQYEQLVQNKINQIINSKTMDKNAELSSDDIMR